MTLAPSPCGQQPALGLCGMQHGRACLRAWELALVEFKLCGLWVCVYYHSEHVLVYHGQRVYNSVCVF